MREAGVDPASIKTWSDLGNAAHKLTVRNADGTVARWGYGQAFGVETPNPQLVVYYMLDKLGSLVDGDGRAAFATRGGAEGLRIQVDLVRKDMVTPEYATTLPHDDLWDQFGAGRFAMMQGSSTRIPNLQKALGSDNTSRARTRQARY